MDKLGPLSQETQTDDSQNPEEFLLEAVNGLLHTLEAMQASRPDGVTSDEAGAELKANIQGIIEPGQVA